MNKKLKNILTLRNSILLILSLFCIIASFYLYGRNKSKVFQDEYMSEIFIEEEKDEDYLAEEITTAENTTNSKENKIVVEIKGEVKKPDVYEVEDSSIIKDLIEKAGGLTENASIDKINRAEKLKDNQLIIIPNKNEVTNTQLIINNNETSNEASTEEVININSADLNDLQKINGIGEVKAKSILDYREKNGGFKSIEDLKNVDGIGEKTFEKIKDQIKV